MPRAASSWGTKLKHPRLVVFSLGLLTAVFMTLVVWPRQTAVTRMEDPYAFSFFGRGIAEGHGFPQLNRPDLPTMRRAPLYPTMIALLYVIGGPHTNADRLAP